ncbi:glycosyltransferase family 2 protein [Catenuloplanes atrovinosus]|uniref:Tetratricopeptide (TPR) repeat protein n=1 Tax=Catenuloplanes atrovinosus TaxID=137266 RepID=A0AAE3YUQ2_9ACTN|nr:glycosyltransferase family 2 protein [Catenuloplanes atrovinosus]MDR7278718.1 tetratricopeptide (TPR) repeat protein [Catenuloplanes atrovinosus]
MSSGALDVVVTGGGTPAELKATLEALRPALGVRDEVVCAVPPGRADLSRVVAALPWVREVPGGRAEAVAATAHDLLLLVDGDMMLPRHWLDAVREALDDGTVVAAGPRCIGSIGPQRAELDPPAGVRELRDLARDWRERHRGRRYDVDRLGPVCVALRRSALLAAGGPTPDLPYERLRDLGRIVLVDDALVAHAGSAACGLRVATESPLLLSASMIVRDEARGIGAAVDAITPFVDEVVVYDTGSLDDTVAVARAHGARVIEGFWDEHFGDARNRAIAHCTGRWVLWVDADEIAVGDPAVLRRRLSGPGPAAYRLRQVNEYANGTQVVVFPRLFQRDAVRLAGRLHEQVVDRITGGPAGGPEIGDVELRHAGYQFATFVTKDKAERNRRLALRAVEDRVMAADALVNLARAEYSAGNLEASVDAARRGLDADGRRPVRIKLLTTLIRASTALSRVDDALRALDELRTLASKQVTVDHMELLVRYAEGDDERVVALARAVPELAEDDGAVLVARSQLASYEIHSLIRLGRTAEAADRLRSELRAGRIPMPVVGMADTMRQAGSDAAELAAHVPPSGLRAMIHEMGQAPVSIAEPLADGLWHRFPDDRTVLAFAAWLGPRMPVLRALEWSSRLRRAGHDAQCPLLGVARNPDRTARDRSLAAAVAFETFHDPGAMPLLSTALDEIPPDEETAVLDELRLIAPGIAAAVEPAT